MKKIMKLTSKHIKRTFGPQDGETRLIANYLKSWLYQKQKLEVKSEWEQVQASIILQGVANKQAIENAYILARDGMEHFWNTLDYAERVRLINIDLQKVYDALPSFQSPSSDMRIMIPFFDEKMNELYQKDMVKFELKQYKIIQQTYVDLIHRADRYGFDVYRFDFIPTNYLCGDNNYYVLYHPHLFKFFVVKYSEIYTLPVFDKQCKEYVLQSEQLYLLSKAIYEDEPKQFFDLCETFRLYSEGFLYKLKKEYVKKDFFSFGKQEK